MELEQVKQGLCESLGKLVSSLNIRLENVLSEPSGVVWSRMFDVDERNLNHGQTADEAILEALPRFAWHAFRTLVKMDSCPLPLR